MVLLQAVSLVAHAAVQVPAAVQLAWSFSRAACQWPPRYQLVPPTAPQPVREPSYTAVDTTHWPAPLVASHASAVLVWLQMV